MSRLLYLLSYPALFVDGVPLLIWAYRFACSCHGFPRNRWNFASRTKARIGITLRDHVTQVSLFLGLLAT